MAKREEGSFAGTLHDLTDVSLGRYIRDMAIQVADGVGGRSSKEYLRRALHVRWFRRRLRLRYRARHRYDGGTDSYDRYYRFDDPPTYEMAARIDWMAARCGRWHVFDWPDIEDVA